MVDLGTASGVAVGSVRRISTDGGLFIMSSITHRSRRKLSQCSQSHALDISHLADFHGARDFFQSRKLEVVGTHFGWITKGSGAHP